MLKEVAAYFGFQIEQEKLDKMDSSIEGLIHKIKEVAVVAGALEIVHWTSELVEGVAHAGDELVTTAQKIGVTAHELQALQFAARAVNVDAGTLTQGLGFLQRNAFAAANGSKEMAATFAKLGVKVRGPNGELKDVNQLMLEVADGLNNTSNESEKTALSMAVLGRAGKEFKPLFARGAEGVKELTDRFEELGGGISDETIKKSRQLDEAQKEQTASMNSLKAKIADGLLPAKIALTKALVRLLQWFNSSPRLIALVTTSIQVLTKALLVLAAVKTAQILAPFMAQTLLPIIANVANFARELGVVASMQGGLRALGLAAWGMMKPFLTVMGVVAGLVLLYAVVEDFVGFLQGKDSVIGDFIRELLSIDEVKAAWESFLGTAKNVIGFVTDPFGTGIDEQRKLDEANFMSKYGEHAVLREHAPGIQKVESGRRVKVHGSGLNVVGGAQTSNSFAGGSTIINVNGAGDPKAVAAEVHRKQQQARAEERRQAHANFDSTPEGSGV